MSRTPRIPPPAIAPFDEKKAKEYQQACAKHLGLPVEMINSIGMKLTLIPSGEFEMGSSAQFIGENESRKSAGMYWYHFGSEGPQHHITFAQPFYLGVCHVTVAQFRAFVNETGYKTDAEKDGKGGRVFNGGINWAQERELNWHNPGFAQDDNHPVVQVSWNDATAFCDWLVRKEGKPYCLPTEARWEYACRAGSMARWCFGDDESRLDDYAWRTTGAFKVQMHPVGQKKPNAWGLYDMHGNAWAWCADRYDERYYSASPASDPKGPSSGSDRVVRGGSWGFQSVLARSASRFGFAPDFRLPIGGFRVCLTLSEGGSNQPSRDHDRDLAQWVLGIKGGLEVELADGKKQINSLPDGPFHVTSVNLHDTKLADEDVARLAPCDTLRSLTLWGCRISDAAVSQIGRLRGLKDLSLCDNGITDNGLVHLKSLHDLEHLDLPVNPLTGEGFGNLSGMTKLRFLNLQLCGQVTDEGVAKLAPLHDLEVLDLWNARSTDRTVVF